MKKQQSGFTLVEIAIVLVIIGLLLGGVLKGQELIASAKVKNLIGEFNGVSAMVYAYQDKFRAFPGDQDQNQLDASFGTAAAGAPTTTTYLKNGRIDGDWKSESTADESAMVWQHLRLANLATGPTATSDPNYYPRTADGGRIGLESGLISATGVAAPWITGMKGAFYICSDNIQGKYAKQIDKALDDGEPNTGSVQITSGTTRGSAAVASASVIVDGSLYTLCKGF